MGCVVFRKSLFYKTSKQNDVIANGILLIASLGFYVERKMARKRLSARTSIAAETLFLLNMLSQRIRFYSKTNMYINVFFVFLQSDMKDRVSENEIPMATLASPASFCRNFPKLSAPSIFQKHGQNVFCLILLLQEKIVHSQKIFTSKSLAERRRKF